MAKATDPIIQAETLLRFHKIAESVYTLPPFHLSPFLSP